MPALSHQEINLLFLSLGMLLVASHLMAHLAARFGQPRVLAELLAGIILGPTVLGAFFPSLEQAIFPSSGPLYLVFDGITKVAISFFLLSAGLEIDLLKAISQKKAAALVGTAGLVFPFASGFTAAWYFPGFFGQTGQTTPLVLALFVATALSISALPVIAKILMDHGLYRSEVGTVIIAGAVLNDLAGWLIFGVLLGLVSAPAATMFRPPDAFIATLIFVLLTFTAGRWLLGKIWQRLADSLESPRTILGLLAGLSLIFSCLAGWIGLHPNFGAFVFGAAAGNSAHLSRRAHATIESFVSNILAPLFFSAIGLRIDFIAHFDWALVLVVVVLASISKVVGCAWGARAGGFDWTQAWLIGIGLNARGAIEIILALLALQAGAITERLFVALVIMAIVTSMLSAAFMPRTTAAPPSPV